MNGKKTVSALVVGGEANAGPPLGPALGPLGVNVMAVVKEINDRTKEYSGMRVPVKILVDTETKQVEVEVGVPTTSALIVKEAVLKKGSGKSKTEFVGNLTLDQVVKIAKAKQQQSYGSSLKSVACEVLGSCVSMGVKVEGLEPQQVLKQIREGKWSDILSGKQP